MRPLRRRIALGAAALLATASAGTAWVSVDPTAVSLAGTDGSLPGQSVVAAPPAGEPADLPPLPEKTRARVVEPTVGGSTEAEEPIAATTPSKPRSRPERLPYGSLETDRPGWIQAGSSATPNPNASADMIEYFEAQSCVAATACPDGRPIAVDTVDKRQDFLRGLMDDRVTWVLLTIANDHRIVVNSARSSHSRYVQDRSGRAVDSNHAYGRAADISFVDGTPCSAETAGQPFTDGFDNPLPRRPGTCAKLAGVINYSFPAEERPTEVIYYFDVGEPSGVALENHDDHVHIGFNAF